MKIFGYKGEGVQPAELAEITLQASPTELRKIALFLNACADGMETQDYATSYGTKGVEQKGEKCVEYFAYKDGLPLKVVCPKS